MRPDRGTRRVVAQKHLRLLGAIAAAIMIGSAAAAEDVRYGHYERFTLYKQDRGPIKDDVLFLFHGFGSAMPNGAYKTIFRSYFQRFSVIGFTYDYFDLPANDAAMDVAWDRVLKDRNVTFAGTSLGGFWANYYAERYGVERVVLVNPVVDPVEQLKQFLGPHYVEKRDETITVTMDDLNKYEDRVSAPEPGLSRLVILSRDDEVLDYRRAKEAYSGPGNTVVVFDKGGHTVDLGQRRYLDVIDRFLTSAD